MELKGLITEMVHITCVRLCFSMQAPDIGPCSHDPERDGTAEPDALCWQGVARRPEKELGGGWGWGHLGRKIPPLCAFILLVEGEESVILWALFQAKAISMADQFTLPNTQYMFITLASINFFSKPLLDICRNKLIGTKPSLLSRCAYPSPSTSQ